MISFPEKKVFFPTKSVGVWNGPGRVFSLFRYIRGIYVVTQKNNRPERDLLSNERKQLQIYRYQIQWTTQIIISHIHSVSFSGKVQNFSICLTLPSTCKINFWVYQIFLTWWPLKRCLLALCKMCIWKKKTLI